MSLGYEPLFPDSEVFNRINNQICPDKSDCKLHQEDKCNKWHPDSPMLAINWKEKYDIEEIMNELYDFLVIHTSESIELDIDYLYDNQADMLNISVIVRSLINEVMSIKTRAVLAHMIFIKKVMFYSKYGVDFYIILNDILYSSDESKLFYHNLDQYYLIWNLIFSESPEFYSFKEYQKIIIHCTKLNCFYDKSRKRLEEEDPSKAIKS
jgi:hypothetical protein